VRVGDDQLHTAQATGLQPAQELGPERAAFAVADVEAEHLAAAVGADPGGHHDGLGGDPAAAAAAVPTDAGLAVGGVHEQVGKLLLGKRPVPERGHLDVKIGADPGDLALGDPGIGAQRGDQVIDLAGGNPVHIGLHHHREQRLIDAAATLQQ
jgi:hypothetical protein